MNKSIYITREAWLEHAVKLFTPVFQTAGYEVPRVRVACGWPHARGTSAKNRCLGEYWTGEAAADGVPQIFISPYLTIVDDAQGVLATLVHEIVHATVGVKANHGKKFRDCALKVGLEGKMTATNAGTNLLGILKGFSNQLGEYPHAKLDLTKSPVKKQSTRMHKAECSECGYTVRLSQKWLDEVGSPHCPKHGAMNVEVKPDEPEEE